MSIWIEVEDNRTDAVAVTSTRHQHRPEQMFNVDKIFFWICCNSPHKQILKFSQHALHVWLLPPKGQTKMSKESQATWRTY